MDEVDDLVNSLQKTRDRQASRGELPPMDDDDDTEVEAMSKAEIEALIDELEAGGISVDMIGAITGKISKPGASGGGGGGHDIISRLEKQFKELAKDIDDTDKATDEGDSFIAELLGRGGATGGGGYDVDGEEYGELGLDPDDDADRAAELEARLARIEEMLRLTEEMGLDDDD